MESRKRGGYIKGRLSKHEYPRKIEFVKQLPKTADGKVKRKELRERNIGGL